MNNREFIREEFELLKKYPEGYEYLLPLEKEILRMSEKISRYGFSGAAAGIAIPGICASIRKLLLFEPVAPVEDDEWGEVFDTHDNTCQNKRCGGLFKDVRSGRCYYIYGIIKREVYTNGEKRENPPCWSGGFILPSTGENVRSRCYVKSFPFVPKMFYVDTEGWEVNRETGEKEAGTGWWETRLLDETQLDAVREYYDLELLPDAN
jgi:hypothetical protein